MSTSRVGQDRRTSFRFLTTSWHQVGVEAVADIKRTSEDGFFMNQSTKETDGKRLYAPPRLTTISLRPEEAVLGACKSLNTGGSMGGRVSSRWGAA